MGNIQFVEKQGADAVNIGRHQAQCSVCKHPNREELEHDYLHWFEMTQKLERCGLNRFSWNRHVKAMGLREKRFNDLLPPLERFIERGNWAPSTAAGLMKAIQLVMQIRGARRQGKTVENPSAKEVLQRMSPAEREDFARDGSLPSWISAETDAAPSDGQEDSEPATDTAPAEGQEDANQDRTTKKETIQ